MAYNIPHAGVYWDGYGASLNILKTYQYRGCDASITYLKKNSYCIALIAQNGWKVPKDYPYKF